MNKSMLRIVNLLLMGILMLTSTSAIIVSKSINSLPVIYIDPGHGGPDGGAVTNCGSYEKDIVLSIAKFLKEHLERAGFRVLMTRDGDYDLSPKTSKNHKREDIHKRVDLINSSNCLLYISIHANSYPHQSVYGAQTFYNKNSLESKELSESIQEALGAILLNTQRVAKSISGKYLIDHVQHIGCLVEVGFLSNLKEAELLKNPIYQERVAFAIYVGISNYLER